MLKINVIILFLITIFCSFNLYAESVINYFDSLIDIKTNSELIVQEQINITTDGITIQHGIYRDFPTQYPTAHGEVSIQFKVLKTELNGKSTPHFETELSNGLRIYMGEKGRVLPAGTYTFTITYSALGELGYFKDHDELYWNVTGNGWVYPILKARALVKLPKGAFETITGYTAYTGVQGSREQNYLAELYKNEQTLIFQTTKPLEAKQGLTIVVGWKKGFVSHPPFFQLETNQLLLILTLGLLTIFSYYFWIWTKLGAGKQSRVVIPQYEPPEGYTPAALRYISRLGAYDKKILVATVINLAVKGYLKITADEQAKNYTLTRESDFNGSLPSEELELGRNLFSNGRVFELEKQTTDNDIETNFTNCLAENFKDKYFITNTNYKTIGVGLTFALLGLMALVNNILWPILALLIFLLMAPLVVSSLSDKLNQKILIILGVLVYLSLFMSAVYGIAASVFGTQTWLYCLLFLVLVFINLAFLKLLNYPTKLGQPIIEQTKGFKLFLNATEKDRLNFRNPPDLTPEIFEKYLPYALALGVEQHWGEQFTTIFAKIDYQPTWYAGTMVFSSVALVSSISSSFSNAVSSATTAPGSSSGFGGGGSSGGGGGGGGGGGW